MANSHESPDREARPPEKPSRLLWWLHPKVALPLTLLILLLSAPFLYRGYRISRVPDIGDPFDVEAFGTVNITPADNAMTQYALATTLLRKRGYSGTDLEDEEKARTHGWTFASAGVTKWLDDNQPALAEWRKGTELSQAVVIQPKDFRFTSTLEVVQESREFSRLATLQAERCAHDGDLDAAWEWLLADVRASRHVEQNGGLIQRLVGIAILQSATDGMIRWSAQRAVTPDLLRKALAEFREADRLTPPNSVALKTEYLVLRNTLREITSLSDWFPTGVNDKAPGAIKSSALFVMGEPELSLKVFQHIFANHLSEIDKPKRDRAPSAAGVFQLYDLPPGTTKCLPARELDKIVDSAVLARLTLPAYQQADVAMQREAARRAAVSLMLACQLHFRLHSDWPAKVEDLVPDILAEPPVDPLGKEGELMRLKRDGDDLVIYSVGLNGADDGGNMNGTRIRSGDCAPYSSRLLASPVSLPFYEPSAGFIVADVSCLDIDALLSRIELEMGTTEADHQRLNFAFVMLVRDDVEREVDQLQRL